MPEVLERKCSLLENKDRFAISVIWILNSNADVISYRLSKTIIRSKIELTFQEAQYINTFNNEKIIKSITYSNMLAKNL